jgi:hypothetical protein
MISIRRGLIIAAFTLFGLYIAYHALSSSTMHVSLDTPAGQPGESVTYTCGPPWGSDYVHGPAHPKYPLSFVPCATRNSDRTMSGVDVILALAGIVITLNWARFRHTEGNTPSVEPSSS